MSDTPTFDQLLQLFKAKANDSAESLIQLINDKDMCNALVSWQTIQVKKKGDDECPHPIEDENECWSWMWDQVAFDQKKFSIMVNVQEHEISRILTRIIGLRLVYPDGTIHPMAKQYLRQMIMAKLPRPKKKEEK